VLPQHLRNAGAYQTLKSRGFNLVSNDTLRTAITHLYEAQYGVIDKLDFVSRGQVDRWLPVMAQRFEQDHFLGPARPLDYAVLAEDKEFRGLLNEFIAIIPGYLPFEEATMAQIIRLIAVIERETGGCISPT
jgi:hypothetical protein